MDTQNTDSNDVATRLGQAPETTTCSRGHPDDDAKGKGRVLIACTICRAQHLRCDAAQPACSRCRSLNKKCVYTNLRRTRRKQAISEADKAQTSSGPDKTISEGSAVANTVLLSPPGTYDEFPGVPPSQSLIINPFQGSIPSAILSFDTSTAIDGFYTYFFKAHPFVLPRHHLRNQLHKASPSVTNLICLIRMIGSLYMHDDRSGTYKQEAERICQLELLSDGFSVQTLMLFALTLEWFGDCERSEKVLERARSMALAIGLNRQSFSLNHGQGDLVLEESWRRTWWELYVVDATFAGIRNWPTFPLWTAEMDTSLPGEEESYTTSNIFSPRTLQDYDNRGFEESESPFSSFTYLIDAARILGTTLAVGDIAGASTSALVKNAEANIMSWELHLPQTKRDAVRVDGTVDEILFRAHMVINTVATHLHRPRSALHYTTMELLSSKYAPPLPGEVVPPEEKHQDKHTHKAIRAATTMIELLTVVAVPKCHTPFIMCMGSMAMATHLSACEYVLRGSDYAFAKDRVRMFLGILKAFEGVWPQATVWFREIAMMAKAVFENRDPLGNLLLGSDGMVPQVGEEVFGDAIVEDLQVSVPGGPQNDMVDGATYVDR